jgi:acetolactate synthase-1/2/3 large subunit
LGGGRGARIVRGMTDAITETLTGAEAVAAAFADAGVPAICGVPGGGSSLDLLAAAKRHGIPFLLARQETAAAIMAGTIAELTRKPVGVLTTRGPGVSNAANGIANCDLERAPVVLVGDGFGAKEAAFATHQRFDQAAMMRPVTRAALSARELPAGVAAARALEASLGAPRGPAYLELAGDKARGMTLPAPRFVAPALPPCDAASLDRARAMLAAAERPVVVAGLEATDPGACEAVRALVEALRCPALVTYKAKGVVPDAHPLFAGVFTGGEAEAPVLREADLILLAGADPVEFIAQPWRYAAPVIEMGDFPRMLDYRAPEVALHGDWPAAARALAGGAEPRPWPEVARLREAWLAALGNGPSGNRGLSPQRVVEVAQAACEASGADPRVSVDAGAHMLPCTSFWRASRPGDLLISNGLASMGFALPAGIAAAWHDPARGAIAFTGDGGLFMALGELATAATLGAKLVVVVFNDATLSLIDIKRGSRDLPEGCLDWPEADFSLIAQGCGMRAWRVGDEASYAAALREALASKGPSLIDVRTDPSSYPAQIKALRG